MIITKAHEGHLQGILYHGLAVQFCEMRAMHDLTNTDDTGFTYAYSMNYRHVTFTC